MTIDAVSLYNGKLENGTGEFGVAFGDYVFLHANE